MFQHICPIDDVFEYHEHVRHPSIVKRHCTYYAYIVAGLLLFTPTHLIETYLLWIIENPPQFLA